MTEFRIQKLSHLFKTRNSKFANSSRSEIGFTMIEVMVAISVLAVGIIGVLGLISQTVRSGTDVRQRLIAANLAQEGIEVVRGIRDANWIQGEAWSTGLETGTCEPSGPTTSGCPFAGTVNFSSTAFAPTSNPDEWRMLWSGTNYVHNTGGEVFSRRIEISYATDVDDFTFMRIQSIVDWDNQQVIVEENLYDWK